MLCSCSAESFRTLFPCHTLTARLAALDPFEWIYNYSCPWGIPILWEGLSPSLPFFFFFLLASPLLYLEPIFSLAQIKFFPGQWWGLPCSSPPGQKNSIFFCTIALTTLIWSRFPFLSRGLLNKLPPFNLLFIFYSISFSFFWNNFWEVLFICL